MIDLDKLLSEADALPPLPQLHTRMIGLAANPETTVDDIIEVVQLDPGLTANVLKLANSSAFGAAREITSLRDAVVRLGLNRILCLLFASNDAKLFRTDLEGYGLSAARMWRHAVACAFAGEAISHRADKHDLASAAFTAGLLSTIGKTILSPFVKEHRTQIEKRIQEGRTFIQAERDVLGVDHAEAGGRLAESWQFPPSLVAAIRHHKTPHETPGDSTLPWIVHLSEMLTISLGFGLGGIDGMQYAIESGTMKRLGLTEMDLEWCGAEVVDNVQRSESFMNVADEE